MYAEISVISTDHALSNLSARKKLLVCEIR